jgi:hypothetical protein
VTDSKVEGRDRCEDTGLLVAECACKDHRGEPEPDLGEEPVITGRFVATWGGQCGRCGDGFREGEHCGFDEKDVLIGPCCMDVKGG